MIVFWTEVKVGFSGGEAQWYSLDDPDVAPLGADPSPSPGETASGDSELETAEPQLDMEVDEVDLVANDETPVSNLHFDMYRAQPPLGDL